MAGRKRKPIQMKILQGTYQPCRDADRKSLFGEMKALPSAPDYVTGPGLRYYNEQGNELIQQGRLTEYDLPLFIEICFQISEVNYYASKLVKARNLSDRRIYKICHNDSHKLLKYALTEFGLTQASISKVTIPPKEKEHDPFKEYMENYGN